MGPNKEIIICLAFFGLLAVALVCAGLLIIAEARKFDISEYPRARGFVARKEKCNGMIPRLFVIVRTEDKRYQSKIESYILYYTVKEGDYLTFDLVVYTSKETGEVEEVVMCGFKKA